MALVTEVSLSYNISTSQLRSYPPGFYNVLYSAEHLWRLRRNFYDHREVSKGKLSVDGGGRDKEHLHFLCFEACS